MNNVVGRIGAQQDCPNCAKYKDELNRLAIERQQLLGLLACERERANAFFVSYPPQNRFHVAAQGQVAIPSFTAEATPPVPKPLRYQVVDALNNFIKRNIPVTHRVGKRLLQTIKRLKNTYGNLD